VSVDNSAAGCLRDLSAGGSGTGRSAFGVGSILGVFRRFDCGRRADPLRVSADGGMERAETAENQARREESEGYEGKKLEITPEVIQNKYNETAENEVHHNVHFEFYSLSTLRAEWRAVQSK